MQRCRQPRPCRLVVANFDLRMAFVGLQRAVDAQIAGDGMACRQVAKRIDRI